MKKLNNLKIYLFTLFLIGMVSVHAQITGTISDADGGDVLIGATILNQTSGNGTTEIGA